MAASKYGWHSTRFLHDSTALVPYRLRWRYQGTIFTVYTQTQDSRSAIDLHSLLLFQVKSIIRELFWNLVPISSSFHRICVILPARQIKSTRAALSYLIKQTPTRSCYHRLEVLSVQMEWTNSKAESLSRRTHWRTKCTQGSRTINYM